VPVLYDVDGRVARLTLNRPERGNALMPALSPSSPSACATLISTRACTYCCSPAPAPGGLLRRLRSWSRAPRESRVLEERAEILVQRIARMPINQLTMMKLLVNDTLHAQGVHASQVLGTVFDGIARHTAEGYAFQQRAAARGFRDAVRERDEPFGDAGRSTFKG
jgi:enoyl-CoA hydratase/carnithine racemase